MKQFLKVSRPWLEGWGADSAYMYDYEIVNEDGEIVTKGTLRGKPYSIKVPPEIKDGWVLDPIKYPLMGNRSPFCGSSVWHSLPWEREVEVKNENS